MAPVDPSIQQTAEERERQQRRAAAIEALLELRKRQPPVSADEVAQARSEGRP
jgi:hypothetical protein